METSLHTHPFDLRCGKKILHLSARTHIMGVLNITPDSFSDGGRYFNRGDAVRHAMRMVEEGADIIDVGGESSRPKGPYGEGAEEVTAEEEGRRVLPVIKEISERCDVVLSIDTYKASVAELALQAGASIVNDISGLNFDPAMGSVISAEGGSLIAMHMKGTPKTMQQNPQYDDVVAEVRESLSRSAEKASSAGIGQIMIDPGIGFGKTLHHNLTLIKNLPMLAELGFPMVIGPSRKAFIGMLLNVPAGDRLEGTAAAVAASIMGGASIVRVHDVKEMKRVADVADAIVHAA